MKNSQMTDEEYTLSQQGGAQNPDPHDIGYAEEVCESRANTEVLTARCDVIGHGGRTSLSAQGVTALHNISTGSDGSAKGVIAGRCIASGKRK